MNIPIIYEDDDIVAVNKPAGLAVHGAEVNHNRQLTTNDKKNSNPKILNTKYNIQNTDYTLVDWLVAKYPQIKTVGDDIEMRPGIVHRLDKDTSGVLVAAKNQKAFGYLKKQFAAHAEELEKRGKRETRAEGANQPVKKKYLALVWGAFKEKSGVVRLPIGRSAGDFRKKTCHVGPQACSTGAWTDFMTQGGARGELREAITEYNVLKTLEDKDGLKYSLLEVFPRTGRTHQIRVHMRSVSHPIVGDSLYGFKKAVFPLELKRQFLHAASLEINLPSGKRIKLEAELPEELEGVLLKLKMSICFRHTHLAD